MGKKVLLTEKDQYPVNATVRNFGQVVPSGMSGKWLDYGRRSTEIHKSIQQEFDISVRQNGSVYIASDKEVQQLKRLIGVWLVNSPKEDLTNRLWNSYSPIASSGYSKKIENLLRVSPDIPMISDVVFENHDQEYFESRALDEIMNKIRIGN